MSIVVTRMPEKLMVMIEDDGSGFDPGTGPGDGLGLLGMRERVQLLDGSLTIDTCPGSGSTLAVELPLS